jgi:TRAP-type C4-dicarboxylate transport system permease small subunit
MEEVLKKLSYALANVSAMIGGLTLLAIILMTVASVIGRALVPLGFGPVPGDYEITEMAIAFVIFCFLPLCQLVAGHATVDVFTSGMGQRTNLILLGIWEVALTATMIFVAWRLSHGFMDKLENKEISMLLAIPAWWGYFAALFPASVGVIVGVWSAYDRVITAVSGKVTRTIEGANH